MDNRSKVNTFSEYAEDSNGGIDQSAILEMRGTKHLRRFAKRGVLVKYLEYQMSLRVKCRYIGDLFDSDRTNGRVFFYSGDNEALKETLFNKDICIIFEGYMIQFVRQLTKANIEFVKADLAKYFLTPIFESLQWKDFMARQKNIIKKYHVKSTPDNIVNAQNEGIHENDLTLAESMIKGQFLYALMMHWSSKKKDNNVENENFFKITSFTVIVNNFHLSAEEIMANYNEQAKCKAKEKMISSSTFINKIKFIDKKDFTKEIDIIYGGMIKTFKDLQLSTQRNQIYLAELSNFIERHFNANEVANDNKYFVRSLAKMVINVIDYINLKLNADEIYAEMLIKLKKDINCILELPQMELESAHKNNFNVRSISLFTSSFELLRGSSSAKESSGSRESPGRKESPGSKESPASKESSDSRESRSKTYL